jgi:hypothetical protein
LAAQCLDRRIDSIEQLTAETTAWEQQRNAAGARIKWMFTTKKGPRQNGPCLSTPQINSTQRVKTTVQRY